MKIMAFDPGGTTGVAQVVADTHAPSSYQLYERDHGEDYHNILFNNLTDFCPDVVVCERFAYRQQAKANLMAVEYIGVIKLFCKFEDTKLVMQSPAQAKGFWTDEKLRSVGVYTGGRPHANDAMRHLLYYVTMTLKDDTYLSMGQVGF